MVIYLQKILLMTYNEILKMYIIGLNDDLQLIEILRYIKDDMM